MNLPNKLTVLRVVLLPFFLVFLLIPAIPHNWLWALLVFAAASLTDLLDGRIARSRGLVTNFGKFLDPLADKILVISALVGFVALGLASPIAVILIIAREFVVSGVRLLAVSDSGKVIAANIWGKMKTAVTMSSIIAVLFLMELAVIIDSVALAGAVVTFSQIAMWVCAAITVMSGATYVIDNRELIGTGR